MYLQTSNFNSFESNSRQFAVLREVIRYLIMHWSSDARTVKKKQHIISQKTKEVIFFLNNFISVV